MNLAQLLKAGLRELDDPRRVSDALIAPILQPSLTRRSIMVGLYPALKRRAKFIPTLRVGNRSPRILWEPLKARSLTALESGKAAG